MSLIMDALKKAQQLRSKESKGGPFFKQERGNRGPDNRKWMIMGGSLIGILVLLLVFWWVFLMDSTPPPQQTVRLVERKPAQPVAEKVSPEVNPVRNSSGALNPAAEQRSIISNGVKKEAEKPEPMVEPKPSLQEVRKETEKQESIKEPKLSPPKVLKEKERIIASPPPSPRWGEGKGEEKFQIFLDRAIQQEKKAPVEEKMPSPSPPPPPKKEEVSIPSVRAGQESGKDHLLRAEIIHYFNKGVSLYNQGEIAKAIQAYQKVIEMDPAYVEAYNNLGIIYQELGDLESALKTYQKVIEINPKYEKGFNNIGILFYLREEHEKAEEAFKKALAINSNHIETHINLGTLYKKKGQLDKGIESYQKALAINSLHGETHYNIGLLYEQMGKTDLAIHHYQQFIHLSSSSYPELVSRVKRHLAQLIKTRGVKKD